MPKLVLIDGYSILHRAFYGMPDLTYDGRHTGAVFGFITMLLSVMKDEKPDNLVVCLDSKEKTFRHELFSDYKGTRKPMPPELSEQIPLMKDVLSSMGIMMAALPGYEGDDILGTLSRRGEAMGFDVTIVSGDRDLLQLATEKTKIYMPKTKAGKTEIFTYYAKDVEEEYHVTPREFIDVKALQGDTSDNIPGVPKIGEKTAQNIISEYKSIENAYEHVSEIKPPLAAKNLSEFYSMAQLSKELATIVTDCPIECEIKDCALKDIFTEEAHQLFKKLGFRKLLHYFSKEEASDKESLASDVAEAVDVTVISEPSFAREIIEKIISSGGTAGVSLLLEAQKFYGAAVASDSGVYYIPLGLGLTEDVLAGLLKELYFSGISVSTDDLKRDLHIISPDEDPKNVEDIGVLAYLLDPLPKEYPVDVLSEKYLNIPQRSIEEIFGKKVKGEWGFSDIEKAKEYAGRCALSNKKLLNALFELISEAGMKALYEEIERPLIFTLYMMEREGIGVSVEELERYGDALEKEIASLETKIYEKAGESFNINSPKQLGEILFEKLSLPGGKKTKTGYSTAADVLEKLAPSVPIVEDILLYRQYSKLNSTYAKGLLSCIAFDKRIHTTFQQTVTATGRLSSTEPNLQNIPIRLPLGKEIRKAFLPREGWSFTDADYSQIELRVLAHLSGDENLIEAFKSDSDIHRATAARVFKKDIEDVTELDRRRAKAVNFGIVYGISSFGLGENLNISRAEAQKYIDDYYLAYPALKSYLDSLVSSAKKDGYALTMFNRRRPIPELFEKNFMTRSFGERVAMNSPVQGTAADIMKIAMVKVFALMRERGLSSRMLLQVHDEILIETAPGEEEEVRRILSEGMEKAAALSVPLKIDIETGKNWFDAK